MFSNIVVGTDGSKTASLAMALAADLAKTHEAVLHIVNAYKVPSASIAVGMAGPTVVAAEDLSAEVLTETSKKLLAEEARKTGLAKTQTHSVMGSAVDAIIDVAKGVDADLIVVGSKGMRGARRMIGSVPNSIAHRAPCHVLVAKTA